MRKVPRGKRSLKFQQKINALAKQIKRKSKGKSKPNTVQKKKSEGWWKKYNAYLKSDEWAQLKIDLFERRGRECEKCGRKNWLQVHHLHYKNVFKEEPGDLQILCKPCHDKEHTSEKRKRP
jgi:5-methylcytosine-specific restriction endonuclease McrA